MTAKLVFRNVKRSARDYLVYFLTMTFVAALMFAFNTVIFSESVGRMFEVAGLMAAMIGMATFFIVLIVAWLINYMVRFILEKRFIFTVDRTFSVVFQGWNIPAFRSFL